MQEIFINKRENDTLCVEKYGMQNLLLMENAGGGVARFIKKILKKVDSKTTFDSYSPSFSGLHISPSFAEHHISSPPLCGGVWGGDKREYKNIVFLCGSGDNGADCMVAARILESILQGSTFRIYIFLLKKPKSNLAKMQLNILQNLKNSKIQIIEYFSFFEVMESKIDSIKNYEFHRLQSVINNAYIIIDGIFGSGFENSKVINGEITLKNSLSQNKKYAALREILNNSTAIKIACDCPSGLPSILGFSGDIDDILCLFDYTLAMGALNLSLLDSRLKDFVGKIKVINLGISKENYANVRAFESNIESRFYLLEKSDLILPKRKKQNTNKGSFGSVYIICGEMCGASHLASRAALSFGAGKVMIYTGISKAKILDSEIIYTDSLRINNKIDSINFIESKSQNAYAIGMGLGFSSAQYTELFTQINSILDSNIFTPFIFDADMFYQNELIFILKRAKNIALTPHPKEFYSLLKMLNFNIDFENLLKNIPSFCLKFSQRFPHITLLVKGANTHIAYQNNLYINTLGTSNLAKGGSGDVLSGMIAALMAQGYDAFNATINASLAHSLSAKRLNKKIQTYALTPLKIIESLQKLR